MKIRLDFVTNSSSSSYLCIRARRTVADELLLMNDLREETLLEKAEETGESFVTLKDGIITAWIGECGCHRVCYELDETDLMDNTLRELFCRMIQIVNNTYGVSYEETDFYFDFGEYETY